MKKFVCIEKLPSGNYSVRHWKEGKFIREWFSDYGLAKTRAAVLEVALLAKKHGEPCSTARTLDLLREYVNDPEANRGTAFAEATKKIKLEVSPFIETLSNISELTTQRLKSYLNSLGNQTTRYIRYNQLHSFCVWCIQKGYMKENPFDYIDGNGVKQKITKPKPAGKETKLSLEQIQKLIDKASPAIRLRLLHVAMTGKRRREILRTEWKHLDLENKTWFIPAENSKSKRDSTVPIPDQLVEEFKRHQLSTGHVIGLIHPQNNFNRELKVLARQAGVTVNVTPHVFRHSYASHWRGSPQVLMGLMGWKSPVMIERYTHLNAEDMRNEAGQKSISASLQPN